MVKDHSLFRDGYGRHGKRWVQLDASYDSDGLVDEEVRNPTHWMHPPEPPTE